MTGTAVTEVEIAHPGYVYFQGKWQNRSLGAAHYNITALNVRAWKTNSGDEGEMRITLLSGSQQIAQSSWITLTRAPRTHIVATDMNAPDATALYTVVEFRRFGNNTLTPQISYMGVSYENWVVEQETIAVGQTFGGTTLIEPGIAPETDTALPVEIQVGIDVIPAVTIIVASVISPGAVENGADITINPSSLNSDTLFLTNDINCDFAISLFPYNVNIQFFSVAFKSDVAFQPTRFDATASVVDVELVGAITSATVIIDLLALDASLPFDRPKVGVPIMAGEQLYAITVASGNE